MSVFRGRHPLGFFQRHPLGFFNRGAVPLPDPTYATIWKIAIGNKVAWAYDTGDTLGPAQVVPDGDGGCWSYAGGDVIRLSAAGALLWTYASGAFAVYWFIRADNDAIYCLGLNNDTVQYEVRRVDADGAEEWSHAFTDAEPLALALIGGTDVVVACYDPLGFAGTADTLYRLDSTGAVAWSVRHSSARHSDWQPTRYEVKVLGSTIYAAVGRQFPSFGGIGSFNGGDGSAIDERNLSGYSGGVARTIAVRTGIVAAGSDALGDPPGAIASLGTDLSVTWQEGTDGAGIGAYQSLISSADQVYMLGRVYDSGGSLAWSYGTETVFDINADDYTIHTATDSVVGDPATGGVKQYDASGNLLWRWGNSYYANDARYGASSTTLFVAGPRTIDWSYDAS